jgi:hypothetical protein
LDVERTYLRIEFLTPEEKRIKNEAIQRLASEYKNQE